MSNETVASKTFETTKVVGMLGLFERVKLKVVEASFAQELEDNNIELNKLFELQHKRSVEAMKVWREAHPERGDVWPDLGELLAWMLKERDSLRHQLADAKRDADNCRQIIDTYSRQEDDLIKATQQLTQLEATERQLREFISQLGLSDAIKDITPSDALKPWVELLKVAKCPDCDGCGGYYDGNGEPTKCQFCFERTQLLQSIGEK